MSSRLDLRRTAEYAPQCSPDLPANLPASPLLGYLLGSIPFGLLLTRLAGLGDIRARSARGNIGATNVLRTGRKELAAATLLLDALKGTARRARRPRRWRPDAAFLAGAGAFLGHLFPVWLKFKGGKGVATFLGVRVGLAWPAALVFAVVWLARRRSPAIPRRRAGRERR